jgi:hypothetical protein
MRPGLLEPHTHDCSRHGTIDLFVALDVKAGTVIAKVHRRHCNVECRHFLQTIDRATPAEFELHLVLDKSSTHKRSIIQRCTQFWALICRRSLLALASSATYS